MNAYQRIADLHAALAREFRSLERKLDAEYHDGVARIFQRVANDEAAAPANIQQIAAREGLQQLLEVAEVCEDLDRADGNTDGVFVPLSIEVFLRRLRAAGATLDLAISTLRVIATRIDAASGTPTFTATDHDELVAMIQQLQGGAQ